MTYEQFLAEQNKMDIEMSKYEAIMASFQKSSDGRVSDEVLFSAEFKQAKKMFSFWFNSYRSLNASNIRFVSRKARERRSLIPIK